VPNRADLEAALQDQDAKLRRALVTRAELARSQLDGLAQGHTLGRVEELPEQLFQRLDELKERLDVGAEQATGSLKERLGLLRDSLFADLPRATQAARQRVEHLADLFRAETRRKVETAKAELRLAAGKLDALSPLAILARGYSITRLEPSQAIVTAPGQVRPGDLLRSILATGEIVSRVEPEDEGTRKKDR